jgi:GntR family transcriptional regulator
MEEMKNWINEFNHQSGIPLHRQIETILRKKIATGSYDSGKLFPNEVDLSNLFGVSRNTVRQAFNALVNDGILVRKQGRGTKVVRSKKNVTHLEEWFSFSQDMARQGIEIKTYSINFETVKADEELSDIFDVPQGSELFKLTRIKGDQDIPFVVFESWFPARLQMSKELDFSKPLYEMLEEEFGLVPMHSSEELRAEMASERIANLLNLEENLPVFYRKRLVYDAGMRLLEYNKCYYRHDKMTYRVNIKRTL